MLQLAKRARRFAATFWRGLPIDGCGLLCGGGPTEMARVHRRVAGTTWRRLPWWIRPVATITARAAWLVACPIRAWTVVRREPADAAGTLVDLTLVGWTRGKDPATTLLHRKAAGDHRRLADSCLDDRQSVRIWSVLADPSDRAVANDKAATAQRLGALGIATPRTLAIIAAGSTPDLRHAPWASGDPLFVKPRDGMGGFGTLLIRPAGAGQFSVDGAPAQPGATVSRRLAGAARRWDLLVQPFLPPHDEHADLSPHAPLGLRVNVVRGADGAARVFSTNLRVQPPGRFALTAQRGALMVPFEPAGDRLLDGMLFVPGFSRGGTVPWNGAALRGRRIGDVTEAWEMALTAAAAFPGPPVIGFDLLLTRAGPVMLEANWGLAWSGMHLMHFQTGLESALPHAICAWLDRVERSSITPRTAPA